MKSNWKLGLGLFAAVLVVGLALTMNPGQSVAQKDAASPGKVTVVSSDGAHIIAVDNTANKLYYYSIDKDGKIGDELKLRATVDLLDVGKPSLKPIDFKPAK